MLFDEKLAKIEQNQKKKVDEEKKLKSVAKEIEDKIKQVRSIEEIVKSLEYGEIELECNRYECRFEKYLNEKVNISIFPKEINIIENTHQMFVAECGELNFSLNFNYSPFAFVIKKSSDYKKAMTAQLNQLKINVTWIDQGVLEVEGKKINYCTAILPSKMGNVYQLMFYLNLDKGGISGNFNCQFHKKDIYENLFKAILMKIMG